MRRPLVVLAFAAVAASLAATAAAQQAVFVVRHGEKISDEDERLTEAGRARGARLADMLKRSGITAIYSTDTERTLGTARPLADALGVKIGIYETAPAAGGRIDAGPFVERLRREAPRGIVLVVGHSNTVPAILAALGCEEEVSIAGDEYDNLFVVVPKEGAKPALVRLRY
jgi:broad specificity phosphatase PhoE